MFSIKKTAILQALKQKQDSQPFFYAVTFIIGFLLFPSLTFGQLNVETGQSPEEYVQQLVGSGVVVSNVTFTGHTGGSNGTAHSNEDGYYEFDFPIHQIGNFTEGSNANLGIDDGIMLSTGHVEDAEYNAAFFANSYISSAPMGDPDLQALSGGTTYDIAVLEFDFVPEGSTVSFDYVFGSEEYPNWVGDTYNDVFGFFLSGPGINGNYSNNSKNIAMIPGSSTPISINNVNNGMGDCQPIFGSGGNNPPTGPCSNCEYYVDNCGGDLVFGGYTTVLTAFSEVECGETYHIKIAIGDIGDANWDSGVFLKGGSLTSESDYNMNIVTVSGEAQINAGCSTAEICFTRSDSTAAEIIPVDFEGTAINGEDYEEITENVEFPAGVGTVCFSVIPVASNFEVGDAKEIVVIAEIENECQGTTTTTGTLEIIYEIPEPPNVDNQSICSETSVTLTASGSEGEYEWFDENQNSVGTGNSYTTPTLDETTTYFVQTDLGGDCISEQTEVTISVEDEVVPQFDLPNAICNTDELTLPTTSNNGIEGTWNPTQVTESTENYTFTPLPDNDCAVDTSVVIEMTDEVIPSFDLPTEICSGVELDFPSVSENGVNGTWTPEFNDQTTTTYTFTPDANENCATAIETEIAVTESLNPEFNPISPLCHGESFELPEISTNGVEGTWSPEINEEETTTYTFTPNETACTNSSEMEVVINPNPSANLSSDQIACSGENDVEIIITGENGTPDYHFTYAIDGQETTISSNGNTATIAIPTDQTGEFEITLTGVEDENGCSSSIDETATVTIYKQPVAAFEANAYEGAPGEEFSFENHSTGEDEVDWVHIFNGTQFLGNEDEFTHIFNETGEHTISLTATNGICSDSIAKIISIFVEPGYNLPNIFTPNGDGSNDLLDFKFEDVENLDLVILNRWGNVVFETNDPTEIWNGKVNNTGAECNDGVYFYKFTIEVFGGNQIKEHGFVHLVREK